MGYSKKTLQNLLNVLKAIQETRSLNGLKMLELGNQFYFEEQTSEWAGYNKCVPINYSDFGFNNTSHIIKYFFEHLGIIHTSIDYNGLDGALKCDLRDDLYEILKSKFDIITNLGTTEHVGEDLTNDDDLYFNQYQCFKNLHNLGNIGCIYYHVLPLTKNWYKHGACDYSFNFFNVLINKCPYQNIFEPFLEDYRVKYSNSMNENSICLCYMKVSDEPFISFEEFKCIEGIRSTRND